MIDMKHTLEVLDSTDFDAIRAVRDQVIAEGSQIVPDLIQTLQHATTRQTLNLLTVLIEIGDKRALDPICQLLDNDPTMMLRSKAAEALGTFGDENALPTLIATLHKSDESEMVLMWVVSSIGLIRHTKAYESLISYLGTTRSETMTYMTIRALGEQGNPQAINHILPYLNNYDHHVQRDSEIALKKLGYSASNGDT